jgi:hypothetical protein
MTEVIDFITDRGHNLGSGNTCGFSTSGQMHVVQEDQNRCLASEVADQHAQRLRPRALAEHCGTVA